MKLIALTALLGVAYGQAPKSAKKDLGDDAVAKAAQELEKFYTLVKTAAQTKEKYAEMTAEKKSRMG